MGRIYLDHHSTTPCDPRVVSAMLPYFTTKFGNAASKTHAFGKVAGEAVERAREQIAALIHAQPAEIVFTSGASESNNFAIRGLAEMRARNQRTMTALDDLRSYEQLAEAHADGTKKLLPRFEALYDNMSDAQKKTADTVFARFDRPGGPKRHVS